VATGQTATLPPWRERYGGPVAEWPGGGRFTGLSYPEVWIWLSRNGQTFTALRSTNGQDWFDLAEITLTNPFPPTVFVGLATTSANNKPGFATVAEYGGFGPASVTTPWPPQWELPRLGINFIADNMVLSWLGLPGFGLEWASGLGATNGWMPVTNPVVAIYGTNQVWMDRPRDAQGFFRLRRQ